MVIAIRTKDMYAPRIICRGSFRKIRMFVITLTIPMLTYGFGSEKPVIFWIKVMKIPSIVSAVIVT
jgi:hypothetical protein